MNPIHFSPLYHAYVIHGPSSLIQAELVAHLEQEHGLTMKGNPDVWHRVYETFAIDDARELKEAAAQRKVGEGKRVFIIVANGITREASNALLKTLEEPADDTHFFMVVPSVTRVLPTIISRVRVVEYVEDKEGAGSEVGHVLMSPQDFFALSPGERIAKVKEMESRADMADFVEQLVKYYHDTHMSELQQAGTTLKDMAQAAGYARDQSASLKMIVEYLALVA